MEPTSFFQSEYEAVLKEIRPFNIHGAGFYDIGFSLESDPEGSLRRVRVSDNLAYQNPRIGDRVRIAILMGNVTRLSKVD